MNKTLVPTILALMLILSACAPATTMPQYEPTAAPVTEQPTSAPTAAPTAPPADNSAPADTAASTSPVCISYDATVKETDWIKGNPSAPITIMEYSDFQCPYCARIAPVLNQLLEKYPDDVRLVFRHFPLPGHPLSLISAQAAEAAGKQGMFFEYVDLLFANQSAWSNLDEASASNYFAQQAQALGLDSKQFQTDMVSTEIVQSVQDARQLAMTENISYTPFLLSNGMIYQASDLEGFSTMVENFKSSPVSGSGCPATTIEAGKQYTATLPTRLGDVKIDLFADTAPVSVNAIAALAQKNWFENSTVFTLIPDESGTQMKYLMLGKELNMGWFSLAPELSDVKFDQPGRVGLVNNTQLFVAFSASPDLDGSYTIIGQVTEGLDLLQSIQTAGEPITNIIIAEKK